jgi:broad specificity phosphatase PhoE
VSLRLESLFFTGYSEQYVLQRERKADSVTDHYGGAATEQRVWPALRSAAGTTTRVVVPCDSENGWTRIHLVRHGTTVMNRASRYRGRRDVPLDQGGWDDAWSAARELADSGTSAIYTSPLRRARDTARIVADVTGLEPVMDLPALVNLDYGYWEGLTSAEAAERDPEPFAAYQVCAPGAACPGGESLSLAARRVVLGLQVIASLHPSATVVAVSHAAMVRLALVASGAVEPAAWRASLPNGSVTTFEVLDEQIRLVDLPSDALTSEALVD